MSTLEERMRALEHVEEIKQLKARYAAACDNNYDAPTRLRRCSPRMRCGMGQPRGGRRGVGKFFRRAPEFFPFAIHNVMNPVIEVDGDHATAQWYLLQPATMAKGNQAVWLSAAYRDQYVRVGGKWMFQHLKVTANFLTPYEAGWAKQRFV
jgi:hypothetical protein